MPKEPTPLTANARAPRQLEVSERLEELRARLATDDLTVALKSVHCRRVLFRVLEQCLVFDDVFTPDALAMAYRAGRQSVGRYLWAAIDDVDDQAMLQMRAEARRRAKQEQEAAVAARTSSAEGDDQ